MAQLPSPRIPPLPASERDEATLELLATVGPFAENNLFTTMVHHPRLFKRWVPFGTAMLYARLPARDKELLILRTSHRCGSAYEWEQHQAVAADAGITEAEIEQVLRGAEDGGWSPFDAALVRAVDEMLDDHVISDRTWATLAERYDERLLIEIPMIVGHYLALGMTLNSLGIQPEEQEA